MPVSAISGPLTVQATGAPVLLGSWGMDEALCICQLSADPTVVGGPANFLWASTVGNDDVVVILGDNPANGIDLAELPRSDNHSAFAEFVDRKGTPVLGYLRTGDWCKVHFGAASRPRGCVYFSGSAA